MTVLMFLALSFFQARGSTSKRKPAYLRRPCGTLVHSHQLPPKEKASIVRYQTELMRGVPISLVPRGTDDSCSLKSSPVATVKTGRRGRFEFRGVQPGQYCVVVRTSNSESTMPINYEPVKDDHGSCSDYRFDLFDDSHIDVEETVIVN